MSVAVRFLEFGNIRLPEEVKDYHPERVKKRGVDEGRRPVKIGGLDTERARDQGGGKPAPAVGGEGKGMAGEPGGPRLAARMADVRESGTVELMDRARQLRARGQDVVSLAGGEPDFDTPAGAVEEAARALREGFTHYVSSRGIPELRRAITHKLQRENGVAYDADTEIVVTVGAKMALLSAILALVEPGEEVISFGPAWVSYQPMVALAGGRLVAVPLRAEGGRFAFDEAEVRRAVTPRTKALLVNNPHNPTGKVFSRDELAFLAGLAREHDLVVIADEIYEHIVYDGRRHVSMASLDGMRERTVMVNGFSKAYAMTGWRLGYLAAPAAVASAALAITQQTTTCATSFAQKGAVAALTAGGGAVAAMVAEFARRRQFLLERFRAIPGVELIPPEGTFYAFPRLHGDTPSTEVARRLLEDKQVAVVPGSVFGEAGEGFLRLSFSCSLEELCRGLDRLEAFFRGG
ncbi:MAG: aminotransferase class I/II-fold pyridoxal phosphate-dependent enzyme [Bacillota bacterium]|nr:aminotransferase class I/II-fold pyridoxal phosphate-dependent enzyme [Bacillota bacterium]